MASKILLADDSITIQKVVNLTFADEGIEVVSVSNGEMAQRRLPEVNPDLVLADIFMPGKNGYELCEYIKQTAQFRHIPVVLLVGAFEPFDQNEASRVQADDHLTKPFESRMLVETVRRLIAGLSVPATGPLASTAQPAQPPAESRQQQSAEPPVRETRPLSSAGLNFDLSEMSDQTPQSETAPASSSADSGEVWSPTSVEGDDSQTASPLDETMPAGETGSAVADSSLDFGFGQTFDLNGNGQDLNYHEEDSVLSVESPLQFDLVMPTAESLPSDQPEPLTIDHEEAVELAADHEQVVELTSDYEHAVDMAPVQEQPTGDMSADPQQTAEMTADQQVVEMSADPQQTVEARVMDNVGSGVPSAFNLSAPPILMEFEPPESVHDQADTPPSQPGLDALEVASPQVVVSSDPQTEAIQSATESEASNRPQESLSTTEQPETVSMDMLGDRGFAFYEEQESEGPASTLLAAEEPLGNVLMEDEGIEVADSDAAFAAEIVTEEPVAVLETAVESASLEAWESPTVDTPSVVAETTQAEMAWQASDSWSVDDNHFSPIDIEAPSPASVLEPVPVTDEPVSYESLSEWAMSEGPPIADATGMQAQPRPTEVSKELVDEIVRRVVAQISDSVVREIAWEVVPDCVERIVEALTREEVLKRV
jgi:CheY-like chemotaxis protein